MEEADDRGVFTVARAERPSIIVLRPVMPVGTPFDWDAGPMSAIVIPEGSALVLRAEKKSWRLRGLGLIAYEPVSGTAA